MSLKDKREILTTNQYRVAVLACRGLSNSEIAKRLCITRSTVEQHLTAAYKKLGITSRNELKTL